MKDKHFNALLALAMISEPWPLGDDNRSDVLAFLDNESRRRGYDNAMAAFHNLPQSDKPKAKRKVRKARGV